MNADALLGFATALLTILNPLGNTAIFAGMVSTKNNAERRSIATKGTMAVVVILIGTVWLGEPILNFFGVTIPSLRTAGGLIIATIGFSMLRSRPSRMHQAPYPLPEDEGRDSIAVVPLAMPIVQGRERSRPSS